MLDLLLVNPADISPYPAVGLAELASFVRERGYSVAILDFSARGVSVEDVFRQEAKVVGITMPCGLVKKGFELARLVKERMGSIVILGGYYPTFCFNQCLESPDIDFVVLREGELGLLCLLDYLIRRKGDLFQVPGLAYRYQGFVKCNPVRYIDSLDVLPVPAFDLLPLGNYPQKVEGRQAFALSTGRGCPFGCLYCSQSAFWERRVRFRSPEKVFQLVDGVLSRHLFGHFRILDDIFPLRPKESQEIAHGLGKRGVSWECQSRVDVTTESFLEYSAKAGMNRIFLGIESGSPKIQRVIGKVLDHSMVRGVVSKARQEGLKVKVSFQIGIPGETRKDIDLSIAFAQSLDVDEIGLFISTPFPGTPLHKIARERGLIGDIDPDDCDPSTVIMGTGCLTREEVGEEAQRFLEEVELANWGHHSKKGRGLRKLH